jgi:hypothetical protein
VPYAPSGRWRTLDPDFPFVRGDFDEVSKALLPANRALGDFQVTEPAAFMQRILNGGSPNAGAISDLIIRQVTNALALHLASDDAKHGALALGVVLAQSVGQRAGSAEHALAPSALDSITVGKTPSAAPWYQPG